jgi:hypothetical protein
MRDIPPRISKQRQLFNIWPGAQQKGDKGGKGGKGCKGGKGNGRKGDDSKHKRKY